MTAAVAGGFAWAQAATGRALVCPALSPYAHHLFTTRDVTFRGERAASDETRLAGAFERDISALVFVRQVHGRAVCRVHPGTPAPVDAEADALISTDASRVIAVRVADCVPILMADRRRKAVAAVHAGWRGTCAGVAAETVQQMAAAGVSPADLIVAIGPSIGPCCYQVDARVRAPFIDAHPRAAAWFTPDGADRWTLDLWAANVAQVTGAGVDAGNVHVAAYCTADHLDTCFSYRAEGPGTGRMVAAIALRPNG